MKGGHAVRSGNVWTGMVSAGLCICILCWAFDTAAKDDSEKEKASVDKEVSAIEASADVSEDHPEIPEGVTCADCHQIQIDAESTATQVWLDGNYAGFSKGDGAMDPDKTKQAIVTAMGGKKHNRTCILATCVNNKPLSTTAEFALDEDRMTLHGMHEKGTEKLLHIRQNPRVSLNWHREFTGFASTLCIQFKGTAEIIEADDPEYDRILKDAIPYEERAKARKLPLEKARAMFKQMMVITKITVDEATITNATFRKDGNRPWQRWVRK